MLQASRIGPEPPVHEPCYPVAGDLNPLIARSTNASEKDNAPVSRARIASSSKANSNADADSCCGQARQVPAMLTGETLNLSLELLKSVIQ